MIRFVLIATVAAPWLAHAFLPHPTLYCPAARSTTLTMSCQQEQSTAPRKNPVPNAAFIIAPLLNALGIPHEPTPVSRGDALLRVATTCVGGGSVWSFAAIAASAKAPVMKLPEDDSTKPAQRSDQAGSIPPFTVLPSGVQITDIEVGDGALASTGKGVSLKWVMRRSNGYYVSSSSEGDGEPFIYRVGDDKRAIKGLDEGIRGMKAGGTRRIVVPPQLAYVDGCKDGNPGPIPAGIGPKQQINTRKGEPLSFEVKLTKVRWRVRRT